MELFTIAHSNLDTEPFIALQQYGVMAIADVRSHPYIRLIDYPIAAVAAADEQTRSLQMKFTRETLHRNTNTKDEATNEWF